MPARRSADRKGDAELRRLGMRLRLLGGPSRLRIVAHLAAAGPSTAAEVVEAVGVKKSVVNHGLVDLTHAEILGREGGPGHERGSSYVYSVLPGSMREIADRLNRLADEAEGRDGHGEP